eukprot:snap_masked-scaffold_5-processed-gene-15.26-mRNA-1 protein AED:1.00 eAED:1.00 QI:0/0/0/0/1/1/2/0/67
MRYDWKNMLTLRTMYKKQSTCQGSAFGDLDLVTLFFSFLPSVMIMHLIQITVIMKYGDSRSVLVNFI